jgi:hypothetical protein
MQGASTAISLLGFAVDLMWQRVLMRMRLRSTAGSGGADTSLAGGGGWAQGRGKNGDRKVVVAQRKARATEAKATGARGEDEGNGVNPAPAHSIYRGVHPIYPLRLLAPYNTPQRLYPEKLVRRLRQIFRQ